MPNTEIPLENINKVARVVEKKGLFFNKIQIDGSRHN